MTNSAPNNASTHLIKQPNAKVAQSGLSQPHMRFLIPCKYLQHAQTYIETLYLLMETETGDNGERERRKKKEKLFRTAEFIHAPHSPSMFEKKKKIRKQNWCLLHSFKFKPYILKKRWWIDPAAAAAQSTDETTQECEQDIKMSDGLNDSRLLMILENRGRKKTIIMIIKTETNCHAMPATINAASLRASGSSVREREIGAWATDGKKPHESTAAADDSTQRRHRVLGGGVLSSGP